METFLNLTENTRYKLNNFINQPEQYIAHKDVNSTRKENLLEHSENVMKYFLKVIEVKKIEPIIDNLILSVVKNVESEPEKLQNKANFLKLLFFASIYFHDAGKINPNFQSSKMKNPSFKSYPNPIGSDHSALSAKILIAFANKFAKEEFSLPSKFAIALALVFVCSVLKHHGSLKDFQNSIKDNWDFLADNSFKELMTDEIKPFFGENAFKGWSFDDLYKIIKRYSKDSSLFFLTKITFSLLTASDFLATTEFYRGEGICIFETIDDNFRQMFIKNVFDYKYNQHLSYTTDASKFNGIEERNRQNLNFLRKKIQVEMVESLRKAPNSKIYYLEAPTGSGKTNLSAIFIAEMLKKYPEITNIYYVFPFINLIVQTKEFFEKEIKITSDYIGELHSQRSFSAMYSDNKLAEESDEDEKIYEENFLNYLFANYPFNFISHVRFFDILSSGEKSENYLLHRFANSIVVVDELQAYPPETWDKIAYLINETSEKLNIIYLLMSATLPKFDDLLDKLFNQTSLQEKYKFSNTFTKLIPEPECYFHNPNFAQRVSISDEYLSKDYNEEEFVNFVIEKCENYAHRFGSVRCIIEFLTKPKSLSFFHNLNLPVGYRKFLLNGTILRERQKEIIAEFQSSTANNEKSILVTTQVVEAGTDIDMDIGFKDVSFPDLDEQLAGRINRNASKESATLYLFNTTDRKRVYHRDTRLGVTQDNIPEHLDIFQKKNFNKLYEKVFEKLRSDLDSCLFTDTLDKFISNGISALDFTLAAEQIRLIPGGTASIFVPVKIPVITTIVGNGDKPKVIQHFTDAELKFLKEKLDYVPNDNYVDGSEFFERYESFKAENKSNHHNILRNKFIQHILSTLLSKFTFSLYLNIFGKSTQTVLPQIIQRSNINYLANINNLYSYEDGLLPLEKIEEQVMIL